MLNVFMRVACTEFLEMGLQLLCRVFVFLCEFLYALVHGDLEFAHRDILFL